MYREKGKQVGVVRYKPKAFSLDVETLNRMNEYSWVNFSKIVNDFLKGLLDKMDKTEFTNPNEMVLRLMGDKEETR